MAMLGVFRSLWWVSGGLQPTIVRSRELSPNLKIPTVAQGPPYRARVGEIRGSGLINARQHAAGSTKVRNGIGYLSRVDKFLASGAVIETSDFVGWSGFDKRLHGVERLEPFALQHMKVYWLRQIEPREVLLANSPAPSQKIKQ